MEKYRAVSLDDKMANYKLALISGYRNLKTDSFLYPSPEDQHEEMIGVLNKGNEIWLTYKPFQDFSNIGLYNKNGPQDLVKVSRA